MRAVIVVASDGVGDEIELGGKARDFSVFVAAGAAGTPRCRRRREGATERLQLAHYFFVAEPTLRGLDVVLKPHDGGPFDAEDLAWLGHASLDQRMSDQFPNSD